MVKGKGKFSRRLIFLRFILAGIVLILIAQQKEHLAAFFFIVASLLGFFEGYIQRRLDEVPQRRKILDYTADKILVNATALVLAFLHEIPFFVPIVFLGRDILTMAGAAIILRRNQDAELKPTITGKMALYFQMVALLPAILGFADDTLLMIAAAITVVSAAEAFIKSEFRPLKKRPQFMQFSMVRMLKVPDLLTMANAVCGLVSIMFAISGQYAYAALSMIGALVFDFLDGKAARWLNQQNEFGKELDSLADTVSFGVAPAIFAFSLIQTKLAIIAFAIFVFCGILRLARYNITSSSVQGFVGMPITLNGIIIPLIYFIGVEPRWFPYVFLILGFLMVSSLKIRRLGS